MNNEKPKRHRNPEAVKLRREIEKERARVAKKQAKRRGPPREAARRALAEREHGRLDRHVRPVEQARCRSAGDCSRVTLEDGASEMTKEAPDEVLYKIQQAAEQLEADPLRELAAGRRALYDKGRADAEAVKPGWIELFQETTQLVRELAGFFRAANKTGKVSIYVHHTGQIHGGRG